MQIGRSVSSWIIVIALASSSASSVSGTPMLHVEHVGAALDLRLDVALDRREVAGAQLLLEDPAAGRVDPLADQDEGAVVAEHHLRGGRADDGLLRLGGHQAGTMARLLVEQVLGALDAGRGVGGVAVGTDGVGVLLGDRCAADHDDHLVAQAGLLQRVDVGLEHRHRRGEERREADDVGVVLLDRGDELLRRDLHAEVDDLEAGALEHDVDEVLADVVDVALDGAHQELADRLHAGLGEQRPQHLHGAGHRAPGDEHLGHEEVAALEPRADLLQRGDEGVEEQASAAPCPARAPRWSARARGARCPPGSRRRGPWRISLFVHARADLP